MIIKSKDKEYELTFKARQMIKIGEEIGGQYELELGAYNGDIKILGKLISILSDALTYDDSLNAIDEILEDGGTIKETYEKIFEEMNKKAFFTRNLEIGELPPINYEDYINKMMNNVGDKMVGQMSEKTLQNMSINSGK